MLSGHEVKEHKRRCRAAAVLILAVLVLFRIPFLPNMLLGEEGMHALLFVGPTAMADMTPEKLTRFLVARFDGIPYFDTPQRNLAAYWLLDRGLRPVVSLFPQPGDDFEAKSAFARIGFLAISLIGMVSLLALACRQGGKQTGWGRIAAFAVILYAMTTPLAVGGSVQGHLDGSVGIALAGLAAWLVAQVRQDDPAALPLGCLAGFLASLYKTEYVAALGAAILFSVLLQLVVARALPGVRIAVGLLLGALAGTAVCYRLSPQDYMLTFGLIDHFEILDRTTWELLRKTAMFIYPLGIMAVLCGGIFLLRFRAIVTQDFASLVMVAWGVAIAAGFLWSGWVGDGFPRYFCPSLLLAAAFAAQQLPALSFAMMHKPGIALLLLAAAGIGVNAWSLSQSWRNHVSITAAPGVDWVMEKRKMQYAVQQAQRMPAILLTHSSLAYYFPEVDFMARDYGYKGARQFLFERRPDLVSRLRPAD